jgi:hypothetical protein
MSAATTIQGILGLMPGILQLIESILGLLGTSANATQIVQNTAMQHPLIAAASPDVQNAVKVLIAHEITTRQAALQPNINEMITQARLQNAQ